jgi:hypothetical protein
MEDSTESVSSAYVQVGNALWIGNRSWDGAQRSRLGQGLMGPVLVLEVFVFAQGMPQVVIVPDQAAGKELAAARLHPPLYDHVHSRHADAGEQCLDAGVREDLLDESGELPVPVADQVARLAARVLQIHDEVLDGLDDQVAVGCGVVPSTRMRWVACPMTARMY